MYARLLITFMALIGVGSISAPSRSSDHVETSITESRILEASRNFNRALLSSDNGQYFGAAEDDITIFTPSNPYRVDGLPDGRKQFEYGLLMGNARDVSFQGMYPKVRLFDGVAVVTFFARVRFNRGGQSQTEYWKITDILINRGGAWKVAHLHVSTAR